MPLPPTFDARLVRSRMLSPSVKELTFERVDGAPMDFAAGQWLSLALPVGDKPFRRSYSIASAPDGTPQFQLAVTHVQNGPGSTYLHAMQPGEALSISGPQGFFTRPLASATPSLFVATGTGVTPMRSFLGDALRANHPAPIWLLFGVRSESDILYRDEFERLAGEHPHLRFIPTLSRPSAEWPATARRGYVQTHVKELFLAIDALGMGSPHAYVCGLERMVSSVREILRKEMGLERQVVHTERYD